MSLRIPPCNNTNDSKSRLNSTTLVGKHSSQTSVSFQAKSFGDIYIRSRFISTRPKSPFRKYEQCIRNSFRHKTYTQPRDTTDIPSSIVKNRQQLTTSCSSNTCTRSFDFCAPRNNESDRFRTNLTINLTNLRLTPSPKVFVTSPNGITRTNGTKVHELFKYDDGVTSQIETTIQSTEISESLTVHITDLKSKSSSWLAKPTEKAIKKPESNIRVEKNDEIKRIPFDAELLLMKINELSKKRESRSTQLKSPNDHHSTSSIRSLSSNKIGQQHQVNNSNEDCRSSGGVLAFRDTAFLLELVNHPIVKKQNKNTPPPSLAKT